MSDHDSTLRRPTMVIWGITDVCNLACPHCYSSAKKKVGHELSTTEALWVIDSLGEIGAERIGWTGGEPLIRKDIEQLAAYARDRYGISSGLTTNGIPLSERRARSLRAAGVSAIQVSLDGSTAGRNTAIRGASTREFNRVLDNIRSAVEIGIDVQLAMLLSAATIDDARDMLALARSLKVSSLRFCGFVPWGYAKEAAINKRHLLTDRLAELRALIEELQEVEQPMVLFDPAFGPLPPEFWYHDCIAGIRTLYINATGDVFPCTALLHPDFRVGNVRQTPLTGLWQHPRMTQMAEYPRRNLTGPCADCAHAARCHGACRGITHAATGDLNAPFPNCLAGVAAPVVYCRQAGQ